MRLGSRALATLLLALLSNPGVASALPDLRALDGFLALALSDSTDCDGSGACVAVDVSVNAAANLEVLLFDLQLAWDPSYWQLDAILAGAVMPGVVTRDDGRGFIDDLFGDVGLDPPIAVGAVLFRLVFEVTGSAAPTRDALEIGDLSGFDPFFDRPVLVADESFATFAPTPNARIVTPEPTPSLLLAAGLLVLASYGRRGAIR